MNRGKKNKIVNNVNPLEDRRSKAVEARANLIRIAQGLDKYFQRSPEARDKNGLLLSVEDTVTELVNASRLPFASKFTMARIALELATEGDPTQFSLAVSEYIRRARHGN